jgi:hypothetical protein
MCGLSHSTKKKPCTVITDGGVCVCRICTRDQAARICPLPSLFLTQTTSPSEPYSLSHKCPLDDLRFERHSVPTSLFSMKLRMHQISRQIESLNHCPATAVLSVTEPRHVARSTPCPGYNLQTAPKPLSGTSREGDPLYPPPYRDSDPVSPPPSGE